jgi:hypothetical protein
MGLPANTRANGTGLGVLIGIAALAGPAAVMPSATSASSRVVTPRIWREGPTGTPRCRIEPRFTPLPMGDWVGFEPRWHVAVRLGHAIYRLAGPFRVFLHWYISPLRRRQGPTVDAKMRLTIEISYLLLILSSNLWLFSLIYSLMVFTAGSKQRLQKRDLHQQPLQNP